MTKLDLFIEEARTLAERYPKEFGTYQERVRQLAKEEGMLEKAKEIFDDLEANLIYIVGDQRIFYKILKEIKKKHGVKN